jgi:hypothetical protein
VASFVGLDTKLADMPPAYDPLDDSETRNERHTDSADHGLRTVDCNQRRVGIGPRGLDGWGASGAWLLGHSAITRISSDLFRTP